jgi:hypothetical protein
LNMSSLGSFGLFCCGRSVSRPCPHNLLKIPFLIGGRELVMLLLVW